MIFKLFKPIIIKLIYKNTYTIKLIELHESRKKRDAISSLVNHGPKLDSAINLDSTFIENNQNEPGNFRIWMNNLKLTFDQGKTQVILKFGDGDHFFLNEIEKGSAKPGKRALSKPYSQIDMSAFHQGINLADQISCESVSDNLEKFSKTTSKDKPDFPAEFIYASLSSRWLTSNFDGKLGLIGASEKIDLIERLLDENLYRKYLGITGEIDLIRITQKFACDDIEKTKQTIQAQLNQNEKRLYLFGVGHAKFGLVDMFKRHEELSFLDIGSGIDALAGIIDVRRPYFGNWTNFQFVNDDYYRNIDYLQASHFGKRIFISD
jgi:hypothetical protein